MLIQKLMKNANVSSRKKNDISNKELIQILNDTTTSNNTSSVSENDNYSGFESKDSSLLNEDHFGDHEMNKDLMIIHHSPQPIKQSKYSHIQRQTERTPDMLVSLNSRSKEFKRFQNQLKSLEFKSENNPLSDTCESVIKSQENLHSPNLVQTLPSVYAKDDMQDKALDNKVDQSDLDLLSDILKTNYGVSEDVVNDVKLSKFKKWKLEEKGHQQNRYIIMLKRIIKGKAKLEDINQDVKKDDVFSNSILVNFLSDLLSKTNDKYINTKLKEFRTRVLKKSQKKRYPHVFSRLQDDIRKRQSISSQTSIPAISKYNK